MDNAIRGLLDAVNAYEAVGWIGIGVAFAYLLTRGTKFLPLDPWFRRVWWRRPVFAFLAGGVYGGMLAIQEQKPWGAVGAAALGGALTGGFGAVWFDRAVSDKPAADPPA